MTQVWLNLIADSATPNEFHYANSEETDDPYFAWIAGQMEDRMSEFLCAMINIGATQGYRRQRCSYNFFVRAICETKSKLN